MEMTRASMEEAEMVMEVIQPIDIEIRFDIEKLTDIDRTEGGEHSLHG